MNFTIRDYTDSDFPMIVTLIDKEGWSSLNSRAEDLSLVFQNSHPVLVAEVEGVVIGYIRALTDTRISLYICELLVDKDYRQLGAGKALLSECHERYPNTRMEMLATSSSKDYYEKHRFRPFYGFRKTIHE